MVNARERTMNIKIGFRDEKTLNFNLNSVKPVKIQISSVFQPPMALEKYRYRRKHPRNKFNDGNNFNQNLNHVAHSKF